MAASITNVSVDILFGRPPARGAQFGVGALLRAGVSLNGARAMDFASEEELRAARDAGYIDAYTYATGVAVLAQRPRITMFRVVKVDTALAPTAETYDGILSTYLGTADGAEVFAYFLDVDTLAIVSACQAVINAQPRLRILGFTTDDAAALTTYATKLTEDAANNCLVIDYDKDNATNYNKGMVGVMARLAYNQDRYTPNFTGAIAGIAASDAAITQTALNALIDGNVNVYAPLGTAPVYRYAGKQASGLPTTVYVSAAWLQARCSEATSALLLDVDAAGSILPMTADGQEQVAGVLSGVAERAVGLRKVVAGQWEVVAPELTEADIAAQEMPMELSAQLSTPTNKLTVTVRVSQLPVVDAEVV